jgi:acetyltransferase
MADTDTLLESFEPLFNPKSIAVVGASNAPGKWGFIVPLNLVVGGYRGKLYYVNPQDKVIHGYRAWKSLLDIGAPVDLIVVTVPAKAVMGVLEECGKIGCKNMLVISAGFSETGAEGRAVEERLAARANELGVRIIGPNCMGICSPPNRMFAMGAPVQPPAGNISFLSQSGNLGVQLLGWADREGMGIARFVNSGNEAQTTCDQVLEFYGADPLTKVIIFYLEGIDHGERFLELARRISRSKPIVALKMGITEAGAKAAASHSGAVATSYQVYRAMVRQAGIIEAGSTEELVDLARTFGNLPIPRGNRVGIMTLGGGWGVVTTDICSREGLELPELSPQSVERIDRVLPTFWSRGNPVDMVGTVHRASHFEVMETLAEDPHFDSIISLGSLMGMGSLRADWARLLRSGRRLTRRYKFLLPRFYWSMLRGVRKSLSESKKEKTGRTDKSGGINLREARSWSEDVFADKIKKLMARHQKPIVPVAFDATIVPEFFRIYGLVAFGVPEKAVMALKKLSDYSAFLERMKREDRREDPDIIPGDIVKAGEYYLKDKPAGAMTEHQAKVLLREYGIGVTEERACASADQAVAAAQEIGFPAALKVDSPDILHKTEAGGVRLNLEDAEAVRRAYDAVMFNAKRYNPQARIAGVLVQEMVRGGTEVIIGASRDPHFGQTLVFGLGGVFVEVLKDVTMRILPISRADAEHMLEEIRGRKLLQGFRGKLPADELALIEAILRVGRLAYDQRDRILEMDVNPLVVFDKGKGVKALDALIVLK